MKVRNNPLLMLALLLGFLLPEFVGAAPPAPVTFSQSGPRVTAQLRTGVVKLGSNVGCVVQVDGASKASLEEVPTIEELMLERVSGPNIQDTYSSFSRAARKRTHQWEVTFRPEREGEFVIPPMRLVVDGKTMYSRELTLSVVKDMTGQELGHLEFEKVPEYVYEGQPFTIRMKFGWDTQYDNRVNVANLILPWWNELPGTLEVESDIVGVSKTDLVEVHVNSRVRVRASDRGEQDLRGKKFRILELTRSYVATRSGKLDFPVSWLEFGYVRRRAFSEERETYHVGAPGFSLDVRVLPENGRPPEFSGGVGSFEVKADANRRDIDLGESIKLTVDWTGAANLEFFELPNPARLSAFQDFRVFGTTNERFYGDRRRVVYDLAPKNAGVSEIPALPLVVFDPELQSYRSVTSTPIPIRVRAIEGATELSVEGNDEGPLVVARDIQDFEESDEDVEGVGDGVVLGTCLSLPLLWLLVRTRIRRRGDPAAPAARRRRQARARFRKQLGGASSAGEQARALHEFLGARSREEFTAWEGRNLETWLRDQDLSLREETVQKVQGIRSALDAEHWAGRDSALEEGPMLQAADALIKEGL